MLAVPALCEALCHTGVLEGLRITSSAGAAARRQELSASHGQPESCLLHFKQVGRFRSVRVGLHYRALGVQAPDEVVWFWIGSHAEYDKLVGG
nr:hypothetical protein [Verrucomicrobium sp. 3C]